MSSRPFAVTSDDAIVEMSKWGLCEPRQWLHTVITLEAIAMEAEWAATNHTPTRVSVVGEASLMAEIKAATATQMHRKQHTNPHCHTNSIVAEEVQG